MTPPRMTHPISTILDHHAPLNPAAAPDDRAPFADIPAKPAVYLLQDPAGTPMLLATVGDLRAALRRRLADTPPDHKSKRVEYGRLCTDLRYRIVHSPFAANWHYYRAATLLFPQTYHDIISWRSTHFLSLNPADPHPQFRRTESPTDPALTYLGPIETRRAADKLIETLQDTFDLCRYHHILTQSPHGKPCAYKEMGKCPAPCDGTVPMAHYHGQINAALHFLTAPDDAIHPRVGYTRWRESLETAMRAAASKLDFERAGRLKSTLARAALLEASPYSRLDRLTRFTYLALQPGQGRPYIEPYFIHGSTITPGDPVKRKDLPAAAEAWYTRAKQLAANPAPTPSTAADLEQLALIAHHLFRGEDDAGLYLPAHYIPDPAHILTAAHALLDRKSPPKPLTEQTSDRTDTPAAQPEDLPPRHSEATPSP